VLTTRGRRLEIELKMPGEKRTRAQLNWARMIAALGGVYVLVEYDPTLDLPANVARAVAQIVAAL
jgi:hypothetical protein